jgi:hypothetical protein
MRYAIVWLLLMAHLVSAAQTQATKQTPSVQAGNCSIAGVGYVSNVKIVCTGVPQKDVDRLLHTFNAILSDEKTVIPKLDRIQASLDAMATANAKSNLGNLKRRASALAIDIDSFWRMRDQQDPATIQGAHPPITPALAQEHHEWAYWTADMFMFQYWPSVIAMRDEFTSHNFSDPKLDSIIESVNSVKELHERLKASGVNDKVADIGTFEIEDIASSLFELANELPNEN